MEAIESSGNRSNFSGLGACWIVYGLWRLVLALLLATNARVATVMFGALLVEVPDASFAMGLFHIFYICAIILSIICGILGVLGGVGLLRQRTSTLAVIAAFLSLCELPIGLTLSVYTLLTIFRPRRSE